MILLVLSEQAQLWWEFPIVGGLYYDCHMITEGRPVAQS